MKIFFFFFFLKKEGHFLGNTSSTEKKALEFVKRVVRKRMPFVSFFMNLGGFWKGNWFGGPEREFGGKGNSIWYSVL